MNNDVSKLHLQHQHTEQTASLHHTEQQQKVREFASAEEVIRADRDQTELPTEIASRLNASIAREPKPEPPWWKKFFQRPRP